MSIHMYVLWIYPRMELDRLQFKLQDVVRREDKINHDR